VNAKGIVARLAVCLAALVSGSVPTTPATAAGAGDVEFSIGGTLWKFPCANCRTDFSGTGTGAGQAGALIGTVAYNATFSILAGTVQGTADYSEPGVPLCPAVGSASNPAITKVTLTGGATGIVHRSSTPSYTGTVTNVSVTLNFTYQRVGTAVAITISGGTVTVSYFYPGTGTGSFSNAIVAGAGAGVFQVDPLVAAARCTNPGPLNFTLTGNAGIALA
jgi:hypothetical protein